METLMWCPGNGRLPPNGESAGLKILSVLGTRPEAIKMAPLLRAFGARPDRVTSRVCVTAQHRGLLDQMIDEFALCPDHDLDVMTDGQSSAQVIARILERLEPVLAEERPDWVVVQGDTATTAAAAFAARQAGHRVAHVEAGLRTFDRQQPFPEEIHRTLISSMADLHLAPTPAARRNLLQEGIVPERVVVTGNTGIDSLYRTLRELTGRPHAPRWPDRPRGGRAILLTAHRQENLGAPLDAICRAMRTTADRFGARVRIVVPVHPRPGIRDVLEKHLGGRDNVELIEPLDYRSLIRLLLWSDLVVTDSGGLQEEAPCLGKPVLVLRNVTERPEVVDAGGAQLVGTDEERITVETARLIEDESAYRSMARPSQHYGDGHAAERIVCALLGEAVSEWAPVMAVRRTPRAASVVQGVAP